MTTQKSRKNPRAQVTLLARYRSPTAFEYVEEHCFDLSSGGMFIQSNAPAPAGTLIKLECDVNEGAGTLRGVARVVWLREQDTDGQPKGMGVKFLKLEPGGRELIVQLLGERASLPPADSIPPSRRSWSPSVSPQPRSSSAPAGARSSLAPPLPRPRVASAAPEAPDPVGEHQIVDPSEVSEISSAAALAAVAAAAASAVEPEPPSAETAEPEAAHAPAPDAVASAEAHPAEAHADAAEHHDHRPHAHELRNRLARRKAAQRAAAEAAAAQAAQRPSPEGATAASELATGEPAAAAATSKAAAPGGWVEPASAPTPAAAAIQARDQAAQDAGGTAAREFVDDRRSFTLKGDVPVEEMPRRRGAIYLGMIAVCVVLILMLQTRSSEPTPEPVAAAVEPASAAEPVAPTPAPTPAPVEPPAAALVPVAEPVAAAPAPTYVLELSTTPEGATVELSGQSAITPAQLAFGTLETPVTVSVRKEGFEPATLEIDRTGFVIEGGQLRRHVVLPLTALPPAPRTAPAPPPPPPPAVAVKKPEPAAPAAPSKPAREHRRAREKPAREQPAPEPAAAAAAPVPKPEPRPVEAAAPAPAPAPVAAQSPMQVAMACLTTGDNACVLRALDGKASGPRETELLIETHRAMGNAGKAEQLMQGYIEQYPSERRATTYRRQLERKAAESAPAAPAAPPP